MWRIYGSKVLPLNIVPISLKAPELLIQAVFDGRRLGLQLFNISGMAARLSKVGVWWCLGRRMWVLEQGSADHALAWLQALYQRSTLTLSERLHF